jgi:hypothetical protein
MRAIVPGKDPGPVLNMTETELGDLLDKRCRFDKNPAAPKLVNDFGYSITLANNRPARDHLKLGLRVRAGGYRPESYNSVSAYSEYWSEHKLWKEEIIPPKVFEIFIRCWEPDFGAILGMISDKVLPNHPATPGQDRLWMYWTRPSIEPHEMYKQMPPPEETRLWLDGTLSIWP